MEVHQANTAETEFWEEHFEVGGDSITGFIYWSICSAEVADWCCNCAVYIHSTDYVA